MLYFNKFHKILFKTSLHFAILLSPTLRAEEASILTAATVIGTDIRSDRQSVPYYLISGYFKTNLVTETGSVDREFVIDL